MVMNAKIDTACAASILARHKENEMKKKRKSSNNVTNERMTFKVDDSIVYFSGLNLVRSQSFKVSDTDVLAAEIIWTYGDFIVSILTERGGTIVDRKRICRSARVAYAFAAYFQACAALSDARKISAE